jgi:hypothetical protein
MQIARSAGFQNSNPLTSRQLHSVYRSSLPNAVPEYGIRQLNTGSGRKRIRTADENSAGCHLPARIDQPALCSLALSMNADEILKVALPIFNQCCDFTNTFVVPLAIVRIIYANVTGGGSSEYSQVVKGMVLYFLLIHGFEPMLKILLDLPDAFGLGGQGSAGAIQEPTHVRSQSLLPDVVQWSMEAFASGLYWLAKFLSSAFTVILTSIAPVIFLLGAVLGIGLGLRMFFGLLIMVSSWPIVWTACDALFEAVSPVTTSSFGIGVFEITCLLLKIMGPLALSYFGAHSSPVGQAIASTAGVMKMGATRGGSVVVNNGAQVYRGATSNAAINYRVSSAGQALGDFATRRAHGVGRVIAKPFSRVGRADATQETASASRAEVFSRTIERK